MNILGVEMDYDFFDADKIELYEQEAKRVSDRFNDPETFKEKSTGEHLRLQCSIVDDFFDAVFGNGTAQKLFKGKPNIKDHMEAFGAMSLAAKDANKEFDEIQRKYLPNRAGRNREEKRYYQKQNNAAGNSRNNRH